MHKTLYQIIQANGDGHGRGENKAEASESEDHVVEMVLQACAEETEADGTEESGEEHVPEPVFGGPDAAGAAGCPEREAVAEEVAG